MNILLFGEYSGFFNSLKEGLTVLGHNVLHVGRKDGFKSFPVDISLDPVFFNKKIPSVFKKLIHKITHSDISVWEVYYKYLKHCSKFKNFDVVFLINEQSITQHVPTEKLMLKHLFKHNKNVFLSACGDDYTFIEFLFKNELSHHILSPYFADKSLKPYFVYSIHYQSGASKKLHNFIFKHIKAVIPTDNDYYMAYANHKKALPITPFPVRHHLLPYQKPEITDKIIIFHGINKINYYKKGNYYFEEALKIVTSKYADKIEVITAISLPYDVYIHKYNSCHILLDQAYAYDQGYNALEAMAKGKVVFTGASQQWQNFFNIAADTVAIHAEPDAVAIARKLEWLILHPEKINEISENARKFIEKEHDYIEIAKLYVNRFK